MAFIQDISQLFSAAYASVVAKRSALSLAPLQPAALTNFQIGPEYLDQEQSPPRIVLVPIDTPSFDFAQQMPTTLAGAQGLQKSLYTAVEAFEAHIWGDPDPSAATGYYSFNSTLELRREFIGALYTQLMGGRAPRGSFTPVSGRWLTERRDVGMVNTYGRCYILTFQIAMPVLRDPYVALVPSETYVTPYMTDPVAGTNPVSTTTIQIP